MSPEKRCSFRKEHAAKLLNGIFDKLEDLRPRTIPSEPLRKAIDVYLKYIDEFRDNLYAHSRLNLYIFFVTIQSRAVVVYCHIGKTQEDTLP